jgi:hypothetical protein
MNHIIDRQTFVFSFNFATEPFSTMQTPIQLRFAADELILKSVVYNNGAVADTDGVVQIWCNITNDNLIGAFSNNTRVALYHDDHFSISNSFQTGIFELAFQQTGNENGSIYYNPQPLVSEIANTNGVVAIVIEFVKHSKSTK